MKNVSLVSLIVLSLFFCLNATAQPGGSKSQKMQKEPTKEMRDQMAQMHEKMATCLKSDKSFAECHQEMMADCPMAKDGSCPMMGSKMPMMHHKMMHGQGAAPGCCGGNTAPETTQKDKK